MCVVFGERAVTSFKSNTMLLFKIKGEEVPIWKQLHTHTNQKNTIPPANEGDCDVFIVLSYCVA